MQTTVEDVLEIISDLRGEATTDTDAVRIRAVSRAEEDLALRKLFSEHLLQEQTITSTGVNAYTIGSSTFPMRKRGLVKVYVGDTTPSSEYEIIDQIDFRRRYNENNGDKLAYEYYDVANDVWKVYISPTPETGKTIYYSYYFLPPERTATTDKVLTPSPDMVARLALAYILEGEEEYDLADTYKNQVEQMLSEMMGLEAQRNTGYSSTFGSPYKGIGAY